jgi:hypothetical protein
MPHPIDDVLPDGTCRLCGDRLSVPIERKGVSKIYRKHLTNPDCPLAMEGRGEPIPPPAPR